jgi:hypothetical protein
VRYTQNRRRAEIPRSATGKDSAILAILKPRVPRRIKQAKHASPRAVFCGLPCPPTRPPERSEKKTATTLRWTTAKASRAKPIGYSLPTWQPYHEQRRSIPRRRYRAKEYGTCGCAARSKSRLCSLPQTDRDANRQEISRQGRLRLIAPLATSAMNSKTPSRWKQIATKRRKEHKKRDGIAQ